MGPCVTPGIRSLGWLVEHGFPGYSGNPDFRVTLGTRISAWLRDPRVRVTWGIQSSGDFGKPEFRVTPGTRGSGWFQLRVPGITRIFGSRIHSKFPKSPRTPVSRSNTVFPKSPGFSQNLWRNLELRAPGVTWNCRFPEFLGALGDSGPRSSGWLRELWFPSNSANPVFRVTPGPRSSGLTNTWLCMYCTVLSSSWWTEKPSETCKASYRNK